MFHISLGYSLSLTLSLSLSLAGTSSTLQDAATLSAFAVLPSGNGCYATGFLLSQICSVLKVEF
jgi:hypothetical protein